MLSLLTSGEPAHYSLPTTIGACIEGRMGLKASACPRPHSNVIRRLIMLDDGSLGDINASLAGEMTARTLAEVTTLYMAGLPWQ